MAVAIIGSISSAGSANPLSWTHTVPTGSSNVCLIVGITVSNGDGALGTVTAVTYNGVAMTQVATTADAFADGPYTRAYLFRLLDPPTGANTVSVTFSGNLGGSNGLVGGAVTFANVDQITPVSNSATNNSGGGTSTPSTVTVTSAVGEWTIETVAAAANTSLGSPTQTQQWLILDVGGTTAGGSTAAGATSVTFEWSMPTGNKIWATAALSLKAAAGAATIPVFMHHYKQMANN